MNHSIKHSALAATVATALLTSLSALAEGPMATDDAGTLDRDGMKIEAVLSRDAKERGSELVFGFGPIENVEVGLSFSRATDRDLDPSTRLRGTGIGIKWVPIRNEAGWSLGLRLAYGRERIHDRAADERFVAKERALLGLATYRFENGQVAHANLGGKRIKEDGTSDHRGTWGIGYEFPLMAHLRLTVETFGEEKSRPDKAVGLRYEIMDGLKAYGAVGRGNGRGFGNLGVAWEF